ncbi:hypothetical protein PENTCL1PPCAC_27961 [Pristionchus entomophagus]|uniref:SXP/RAL-2 family protein Ani s 5-like cation-binding domain-containing protein n=1 Tax=Pristionchus entomophagus TaxID=358040 RepID=A0AAV5UHK8_9BILA|nr:hypothetical protein PENTCL1PPCAC_27961 [Pristionchus entomophagus]
MYHIPAAATPIYSIDQHDLESARDAANQAEEDAAHSVFNETLEAIEKAEEAVSTVAHELLDGAKEAVSTAGRLVSDTYRRLSESFDGTEQTGQAGHEAATPNLTDTILTMD